MSRNHAVIVESAGRFLAYPQKRTGLYSTVTGYQHVATITPTTAGSGPIGDVSVGWGAQDSELAGYVRLPARLGLSPDNVDYRAIRAAGAIATATTDDSRGSEFAFDR